MTPVAVPYRIARRIGSAAGVVLLGTLLISKAGAQTLKRTVEKPVLASLTFEGNTAIPTAQLRAAIVSEATHLHRVFGLPMPFWRKVIRLDRAELDRDLLRLRVLYWKRGWRAAQVTPVLAKREDGELTLVLRVTEGPPTVIGSLDLGALDSLLNGRERRQLLTLSPGAPLDLIQLDSLASRLAGALDRSGFGDVTVTPQIASDTSSPQARVKLDVQRLYRTYVETTRVEGTEKYDPRLVAITMGLKAGDVFSRSRAVESQRALYEAGFFKRAVVRVENGSRDSLKKLVAQVEELPVKSFRVTGGVSTVDFFQVDARYTDANFRNTAGRLQLQATVGNLLGAQLIGRGPFQNVLSNVDRSDSARYLDPTFQLNAELRRRWLSDSRNQTGFAAFGYRRSSPGIFVDQGGGVGASFTRNVTREIPISAQYRLEFTNVTAADAYYCVNFGVCETESLDVLKKTQRLAPISLLASSDRRDDPIGPTTGSTWRAELEFADKWTGSQLAYGRIEVDGTRYVHASDKLTIAMRARAGYVRALGGGSVSDIILPRKRFYAGGARSVRGYGENQLGPRVLVISRVRLAPDAARYAQFFDDSLLGSRLPCNPNRFTDFRDCPTSAVINPASPARPESNFDDSDFSPKPLGAEAMVEGSVEARYRFWGPLTFAAFVDAGSLGAGFGGRATVVTPGIGVRYLSPVGPIRVDLGYNPRDTEQLTVITELAPRDAGLGLGTKGLIPLRNTRSFDPATGTGLSGKLFNRLTLHLSIGEAF